MSCLYLTRRRRAEARQTPSRVGTSGKENFNGLSAQTTDTLSTEDKLPWRTIRKELEGTGITAQAFQENQDIITHRFVRKICTEALEEKARLDNGENSWMVRKLSPISPKPPRTPSVPVVKWPRTPFKVPESHSGISNHITSNQSSDNATSLNHTPDKKLKGDERADNEYEVVRVAALYAAKLPKEALIECARMGDFDTVVQILFRTDKCSRIDRKTLSKALLAVCTKSCSETVIVALLRAGANVNAVEKHGHRRKYSGSTKKDTMFKGCSVLMLAAYAGKEDTVKALLHHGANVGYHTHNACKLPGCLEELYI